MAVVAARSRQLVEQYRNLWVVRLAQSLHIDSAELALRSVLACIACSIKNLRIVTRPCQRRIPTIVDQKKSVSISIGVKRELSTMLVSVTHQVQTATLHAVRVAQKRLVKNQ